MKHRKLYLFTGMLCLFFTGFLYAWSIWKAPIAQALHYSITELAEAYSLSVLFFCLGGMGAAWLQKRISFRLVLPIGGALIGLGFMLLSRVQTHNLLALYLFYGLVNGLGMGVVYNVIISEVSVWFPDRQGFCTGLLMLGFGMNAVLFGQIASRLFQAPGFGWQRTYFLYGMFCILVTLVSALILRHPKPNTVFPAPKARKSFERFAPLESTAKETLHEPSFWLFYFYGLTGSAVGSALISFARDFALNVGTTVSFAVWMVGLLSLGNGLGRVGCGLFYDRFGRRLTLLMGGILAIAAPSLLLASLFTHQLFFLIAGFALGGLSYGFMPTMRTAFMLDFYGRRDFSMNLSISNTKNLFSSFSATIAGFLLTASGSYLQPLLLLLAFGLATLFLSTLIRHPMEKRTIKRTMQQRP